MEHTTFTYECIDPADDLWQYRARHWNGKDGRQSGYAHLTLDVQRPESQPKKHPSGMVV